MYLECLHVILVDTGRPTYSQEEPFGADPQREVCRSLLPTTGAARCSFQEGQGQGPKDRSSIGILLEGPQKLPIVWSRSLNALWYQIPQICFTMILRTT